MEIQLFCNSSCQSSRSYEAASDLRFAKNYVTKSYIPDDDVKLSCEDFEKKYGTEKFPFAIIDGNKLIPYEGMHKLFFTDLYKFSTRKEIIITTHK